MLRDSCLSPWMPVDALRSMLQSSHNSQTLIGRLNVVQGPQLTTSPSPVPLTLPPLCLPFPDDILASVDSLRLPAHHSQNLKQQITGKFEQCQRSFQQSYQRTCEDLPKSAIAHQEFVRVQHLYQAVFNDRFLSRIREEIVKFRSKINSCKHNDTEKKPFNAEYTPFLENYFEHNAYPTASDRLLLAQKSMMTPRQIEVWFQNHRNRAKKEGKMLKRSLSDHSLALLLDSLEEKMSVPELSKLNAPEASSDEDETAENMDAIKTAAPVEALNVPGPAHAFPTTYPPNCIEDPFPNDNGIFKFAQPTWRRCPAVKLPHRAPPDMDTFTALFSKLNLREGLPKNHNRRMASKSTSSRSPWFAATVTIPPPAPHPALILLPDSRLPPVVSTSNSFSQDLSARSTTRSSSPCRDIIQRRKVAPLPHRAPSSSARTASSSSSYQASSSRTSSRNSTTFGSRSSSSSSLSSIDLPTPLSTPTAPNTAFTDKGIEALQEYIFASQSRDLIPRHLGFSNSIMARQLDPFSQYRTNPLLGMVPPSYLDVRS